jgi:hypothetical protein
VVTDLGGGRDAAQQHRVDESAGAFMEMEEEQFVGYEHAVSLASDQAAVTAVIAY